MSDVVVAIAGLGRMGVRHVLAVRECGYAVAGVFDREPGRAAGAASELGLPESAVFSSLPALVESSGANALAVASTADSHHELVLSGARAGYSYILCEKPLATSVAHCEEMVAACHASGTALAVNHWMRLTDRFLMLRDVLRSESMGGLRSMTVVSGNIGLAMGVSHYLELFRLLADCPVAEVRFARDVMSEANPRGSRFVDPAGRLWAVSEQGHRLFIEFGADQGHGMSSIYAGRFGQVMVNDLTGAAAVTCRLESERSLPLTRYGSESHEGSLTVPIEDVVHSTARVWKAMVEGSDFPTGEDGSAIVRILDAAERSAATGGVVISASTGSDKHRVYPWA